METSQKGKSRREWLQTEDEGKSSCEKSRVALGVLLVVAVCQNTHLEIKIQTKYRNLDLGTSGKYSDPSFGRAHISLPL